MCLSSLWTSTNCICGYGLVKIRVVLGLWTMKAFFNLDDPGDLRFCLMVAKKRKKLQSANLGIILGFIFHSGICQVTVVALLSCINQCEPS